MGDIQVCGKHSNTNSTFHSLEYEADMDRRSSYCAVTHENALLFGQIMKIVSVPENAYVFLRQYLPIEDMFSYLNISEAYSRILKCNGFSNYFNVLLDTETIIKIYDIKDLFSNAIFIQVDQQHVMATYSIGYEHY